MAVAESVNTRLFGASRQLVVAVRPGGITLPSYDQGPELGLDRGDLELLQTLAGPGMPRSDDAPRPELIDALDTRGLLVDAAERTSHDTEAPFLAPAPVDLGENAHPLVLPSPVLLRVGPVGFEFRDHEGRLRAALGSVELLAAGEFRRPLTPADALEAQGEVLGDEALDQAAFADLVGRLVEASVLIPFDPDDPEHARKTRQTEIMRDRIRRQAAVHAAFDRLEAERDETGPAGRVPIHGIHTNWASPPASLGMIIAAAKSHDGGALERHYDFRPRLYWDRDRLDAAAKRAPGIFLFSNYIWSTRQNLGLSAAVKESDPRHVTIHGGPDTPKYEGDTARFFADNPHVDIAVHGEGEATFAQLLEALVGHVGDGPPDLEVLRDVPGLTFRTADGIVRTEARDRIADLDTIPSPILTGLYEGFAAGSGDDGGVILETNRGCPYGCTFCDWGSATLSRIRKFDLDRLFAELEWCAEHGFGIGIADANYGILERDVAIAEKIAALKAEHGSPKIVGNSYAKNTTKHLSKIIDIFTEAGIVGEGKLSMQTFDQGTLTTIRRKNIKVEKYHDLSIEFRRNQLPLSVELMMGLPGSTADTLRDDMQACINRDVRAAVYSTVLLPNSPMNDPEYRAENGIVARPGEMVRRTNSYTELDYAQMERLRDSFQVFENFAVLRQVATYVRAETGRREIDFYQQLVDDTVTDPERWPLVAVAIRVLPPLMVPPVTWGGFVDDVHGYLVDETGIADDSALATVLKVQHALLPSRDRSFPVTVELDHDYVAWRNEIVRRREAGRLDDWHVDLPALRDLPPGVLTIDDPLESCQRELGSAVGSIAYFDSAWDLVSPVSRPRQRRDRRPELMES